jgi:hypothetical protein
MQVNYFFTGNSFGKFFLQASQVFLLHHKNEIGPGEVARSDSNSCAGFGSGGAGLNAIDAVKDFFSGETAPAVAAANEKDFQSATAYFSFFNNTFEFRPL